VFVRRDAVRALTTAAGVWMTAAVGAAGGAGLIVLSLVVTGLHLVVVAVYGPLARRLPRSRWTESAVRVRYVDGRGVLRRVIGTATGQGWTIARVDTEVGEDASGLRTVDALLQLRGGGESEELAEALTALEGVVAVNAGNPDEAGS
jgi:putative Mg2+ transporter-C (MgtC) family protein